MKRIILPLSGKGMNGARAAQLIKEVGSDVWGVKLHLPKMLRMLREEGIDIAKMAKENGCGLMIDIKGHDIPTETADMVRDCFLMGADIVTIHGSGGFELLEDAAAARVSLMIEASNNPKMKVSTEPLVLVITVLTSTDEENCNLDLGGPVRAKVLQWARNAAHTGCQGTVSSPAELAFLKTQRGVRINRHDERMIRVCPGIRPAWSSSSSEDQKRIGTPAQAIADGADYLVIGRPILEASSPADAAKRTNVEIAAA